jgi:hypothetical protein
LMLTTDTGDYIYLCIYIYIGFDMCFNHWKRYRNMTCMML